MVYFSIFVFGLIVGSFLNVLIYRLPQNLSLLGRSFCPNCKKKISWYDNIPLLSFILLKGKCRFCHSPISLQYPIVELLTGILFVLIFFMLPDQNIKYLTSISYYLFIISSLIVIFFTDLKHGIIPDKITYSAIVVSIIFLTSQYPNIPISYFLSAFGAAAFLGFLHVITRGRGMGLGDVKLAALMGLFLGFPKIVLALYAAFLTGAIVSLILILVGKKRFGQTIPFGPFLILGTILTLFLYEKTISLFSILNF